MTLELVMKDSNNVTAAKFLFLRKTGPKSSKIFLKDDCPSLKIIKLIQHA